MTSQKSGNGAKDGAGRTGGATRCDVIVLGSGAAGLSAAVTAACRGLSVTVIEKEAVLGGTTAWSGGWIWAPNAPALRRAGVPDQGAAPRRYLQGVLGNRFDPDRVDAFLAAAPEMAGFLERETAMEFEPGLAIPDTYGDIDGAGQGGRSLIAAPYDGRALGKAITLLRRPMRETTLWGMTIQAGPDLRAFLTATRSLRSLSHVMRRLLRHFRDLAFHGRGMELRNGAALVGRLLRSALDRGVTFRTGERVVELIEREGRVTGVRLDGPEGAILHASRGVVLAAGGYPHDATRRAQTFQRDREHQALAVPSATGDCVSLGEAVGGWVDETLARPAAMCPVSVVPWPDGSTGRFPHIIERGKPGVIGVLSTGRRFCNEGLGYYDYVEALLRAVPDDQPAKSWLVCDHRFLRRYGLGVVRPAPMPYGRWIRAGYLRTGRTIAELARACGVDPAGLEDTITRWNAAAARGEDPEFGRGATPYMRLQGDPEQKPNPCVAPIDRAPYFAVEVVPGFFGTFAGLATDGNARVLRRDGAPIEGLYAVGADAASVFGGFYPAGGINLGPALTFGFIAGRHLSEKEPAP